MNNAPTSRKPIRLLPPALRNQIAAGEVVERPASVLKELVENSMDAGATDICVTVEDGGQRLIAVRDNGIGVPEEDLELAVTRHATSKVSSFSDLLHVASYGFRGEALPSIASVSDTRVESAYRPDGETACQPAAFVRVRHGEIVDRGPSALHEGTLVEVRDLFANVPARLKFLKTPSAELKRCQETLIRTALARTEIGFTLLTGGSGNTREVVRFDEGSSLLSRLEKIWPPQVTQGLRPFKGERHGITVRGLASLPHSVQARGDRILCYVNGRPVTNRLIIQALREAYKGRLTSREYPQAVIFVEIDPQEIDVNVHPAKTEIRFRDERSVFGAILRSVEAMLLEQGAGFFPTQAPPFGQNLEQAAHPAPAPERQFELPPLYAPQGSGVTATPGFGSQWANTEGSDSNTPNGPNNPNSPNNLSAPTSPNDSSTSNNSGRGADDDCGEVDRDPRPLGFWGSIDRPRIVEYRQHNAETDAYTAGAPDAGYPSHSESLTGAGYSADQATAANQIANPTANQQYSAQQQHSADQAAPANSGNGLAAATSTASAAILREPSPAGGYAVLPSEALAAIGAPSSCSGGYPIAVGPLVCLGQVADTYLVIVQGDALLLVDQHAAHERVRLHSIETQTNCAQTQLLALPTEIPLHPAESARLQELFPHLQKLGYALESTESGVSLTGVPPLLGRTQGIALLRDILSEKVDGMDSILHMMACKSAIKAGQRLTADEAAGLLKQWMATPDYSFCPHGRPTVLSFSSTDLEKMFKRRIS